METAEPNLSNSRDWADVIEVTAQGVTRLRRELHEHSTAVVPVGATDEESVLNHCFQPSQRGRRGYGRSNAKTRDRNSKMRNLRLEKIEQHVPGRVGEEIVGKI